MTKTLPFVLVAILLSMALLSGCASGKVRSEAASDATQAGDYPSKVIDAHTHTKFEGSPERTSGIPQTEAEYFRQWKEANVVGAVAHVSSRGANYHDLKARNVIHCGGVTRRPDLARIEKGLKSGQYGCIKIYLGYEYAYPADAAYQPLYRLAERYDVPVVFHTGDTYDVKGMLKYADPLTVDEVAVAYPKVRFVIAHCGNPWIQSAAEVAYKNPNVYLEGSALLIGNMDKQPREKVDTYVVEPIRWIFGYLEDPSKLMFGTDWPLTDIRPYAAAFARAIPREHWDAVFHDNAVRVFKLKK